MSAPPPLAPPSRLEILIKTVSGAIGWVSNVTYRSNSLSKVPKYVVVIGGDYENGDPAQAYDSVPVIVLTLEKARR